jgi:toxin ParE1/3/4
MDYAGRIEQACLGLADFPLRGTPRDDIRPGVRVMAFRRRVLIAYAVAGQEVTILRILYGGRRFADEDTAPP